jgi:hypothetical protein
MRYTSLLSRTAAGFGIGTLAVLLLSAPASAVEADGEPATERQGPVLESRLDDPDVRQALNQTVVLPGPVDERIDDPGVRQALNQIPALAGQRIDDPGVRQALNQIDSPVPTAPAELSEPLTVLIDDDAVEYVQVAIGALAGGLLVGAGAVALGIRQRHHAVQGA